MRWIRERTDVLPGQFAWIHCPVDARSEDLMDDAIAEDFSDCFGFRMDLKFLVDMAHVGLDRVNAHVEFRCGRLVVMAFHQQFK